MRDLIRFILGGEPIELRGGDPTRTVLDWLRLERGLTGTKEGCAEGDCGACTVAVGRLDGDRVRYEAINSCIRFLPTLDGCHLLTVEHLAEGDALHPVQAALVEHHGSQCGFCTPGFVVSLACLADATEAGDIEPPTAGRIEDAIAGNLCRCTGYRPIVEAGLDCAAGAPLPATPDIAGRLAALRDDQIVRFAGDGRVFYAPATTDQLDSLLEDHPDAILVAGATDVGLWVAKELRVLDPVIFLGRIDSLTRLDETPDGLAIGAGVTHARARPALARLHPHLDEMMRRFGGEQVRNAGTVGGNIANGSPIGDLPPALIALGATLVLRGPAGERRMPLEEFFLGYRRQDREAGEYVGSVLVPRLGPADRFHVSKVSKRFDEDISAVCGAFRLTLDEGGIVRAARLAFGGMAATPKRAGEAERALVGRAFDEEAADAAAEALRADFEPLSDWRASARYRLTVAGNLLRRFAIETGGGGPVRVAGLLRETVDA